MRPTGPPERRYVLLSGRSGWLQQRQHANKHKDVGGLIFLSFLQSFKMDGFKESAVHHSSWHLDIEDGYKKQKIIAGAFLISCPYFY